MFENVVIALFHVIIDQIGKPSGSELYLYFVYSRIRLSLKKQVTDTMRNEHRKKKGRSNDLEPAPPPALKPGFLKSASTLGNVTQAYQVFDGQFRRESFPFQQAFQ